MRKRFNRLAERFGYRIVPVMTRVNGHLTRRPDIEAVEKYHEWIQTIPVEMYTERTQGHVDLGGRQHPGYYECEQKLYNDRFYGAWQK